MAAHESAPDESTPAFDVAAHVRRIDEDGFTVIPDFLTAADLAEVRRVLGFYLGSHAGRNDFEGTRTERVYTLVARGRDAFDRDPAIPLAFEALSNRVGDLAKRLLAADAARFSDPVWRQAARNRDFVVHHYDRVDADALWTTVDRSFAELGNPPVPVAPSHDHAGTRRLTQAA